MDQILLETDSPDQRPLQAAIEAASAAWAKACADGDHSRSDRVSGGCTTAASPAADETSGDGSSTPSSGAPGRGAASSAASGEPSRAAPSAGGPVRSTATPRETDTYRNSPMNVVVALHEASKLKSVGMVDLLEAVRGNFDELFCGYCIRDAATLGEYEGRIRRILGAARTTGDPEEGAEAECEDRDIDCATPSSCCGTGASAAPTGSAGAEDSSKAKGGASGSAMKPGSLPPEESEVAESESQALLG